MPLMNCQDCGNDHSDTATACPKCGKPNLQKRNTSAPPSEFAEYTRNDDGPVVMIEGTSVTAGSHDRAQLVTGVMIGLGLGGCGAVIALAMMPMVMFVGKRKDMPSSLKGLVYGSIPWFFAWILIFFESILK